MRQTLDLAGCFLSDSTLQFTLVENVCSRLAETISQLYACVITKFELVSRLLKNVCEVFVLLVTVIQ